MSVPVEANLSEHEFCFNCEKIAYWFFRLNGCLFLENFLVHHERQGREGTEMDLLSVRFPYRQELLLSGNPMPDHLIFDSVGKTDIILAEIKKGICSINSSWLNSESSNMERILYLIGSFPPNKVNKIAANIYKNITFEDDLYRFRLFAVGEKRNDDLGKSIIQLEWAEILMFIYDRFLSYRRYKTQHRQWDSTGRKLFEMSIEFRDKPEQFLSSVMSNLVG